MVDINLLPWRQKKRRQESRKQKWSLGLMILGSLMLYEISHQAFSIYQATAEKNDVLLKNKIADTEHVMAVIKQNQQKNYFLVEHRKKQQKRQEQVTELMNFLKESMDFQVLEFREKDFFITFQSDSLDQAQLLLQKLRTAGYQHIQIKEAKEKAGTSLLFFTLSSHV